MNKHNEPANENSRNGQGMSKDELKAALTCRSIEDAKKVVKDKRLRAIILALLKQYLQAIVQFAGIGGSTIGILNSGMETVLSIENCPRAAETYELNIDKKLNKKTMWLHTIVNETGREILNRFVDIKEGMISMLQASPVCWDVSRAKAKKDASTATLETFIATIHNIRDLKPMTFVIENVPGLWDADSILLWRRIEKELETLPYKMCTIKLDAADFKGGHQSRLRSFIIGVRNDLSAQGLLFEAPKPNVPRNENSVKKVLGAEYRFFTGGDFAQDKISTDNPAGTITSHSHMALYDDKYKKCKPSPMQIIKLSGLPFDFEFPVGKNGDVSFTRVIKGCGNLIIPSVMTAICNSLLDGVLLPYLLLKHNNTLLDFIDQSEQTDF